MSRFTSGVVLIPGLLTLPTLRVAAHTNFMGWSYQTTPLFWDLSQPILLAFPASQYSGLPTHNPISAINAFLVTMVAVISEPNIDWAEWQELD